MALRNAALAVAQAWGPRLFDDLTGSLAEGLDVPIVFVAVFSDSTHAELRTLSNVLNGRPAPNFTYPLAGSPCAKVVGREFRYVAQGVLAEFPPRSVFALEGMDSYAAYPLKDSVGAPLGLLVALDRKPIADAHLAEAMLKIFAGRMAAEIERGRADDALRVSEDSYRTIFDAAEDSILIHDWDSGAILDVNARACRTYGYSRAAMRGLSLGDLSTGEAPYTRDDAMRHLANARRGDEPVFEWHRRNRDGSLHWDEVRMKAVRLDGRRRVLAFTRDMTQRKEAEQALRAREAQYRGIFEATSDAFVLWDASLRIVDVNPAFLRMYRIAPVDGDCGPPDAEHYVAQLPPTYLEQRLAMLRSALKGKTTHLETMSVRADGTTFAVDLRAMPIQHRGTPHVLMVARDISNRRHAETQRAELEGQLRQAQKMEAIGQLTGGIAHDFNNILTSVTGYLVLASERPAVATDERLQYQIEQAQLAARRARDLVSQMLTFARQQHAAHRILTLAPLLRQAVRLLRATLPSSVELDYMELDAGAEEATQPVQADPVQLEQVLFNLCINARDAIAGTGQVRVQLRESMAPGSHCASCRTRIGGEVWVEIAVSDTGSGIAPEVLERMFDPFYSTKDIGQGSGMGLAMVHGIVHEHGGHLLVDTRPGRGTTFRVLLPPSRNVLPGENGPVRGRRTRDSTIRTGVEADGSPGDTAQAQRARRPAPLLQGHVLVVEDQPMVGAFLTELLESWGLRVTLHGNPEAAARWIDEATHPLDLLLTDQTMPRMTGLQLAQRAIAARPGLPVILCTGNAHPFGRQELAQCGIRAVLRKPVVADGLRRLIVPLLRQRAVTGRMSETGNAGEVGTGADRPE